MHKFVYLKADLVIDENTIPQFSVGLVQKATGDKFEVQFVYNDIKTLVPKVDVEIFNPSATGDLHENKVCNVCHKYLPTKYFSKNQNGKGDRPIRRPSCDSCRKIIDGVSLKASEKKKWDAVKHHLVIFKCPICHKTTIPGLTSKVVLDHNHENGMARAWICDSCNTGLGRFKDKVELLENAIDYLKKDSSLDMP